ncbi:response regulator [bacterium]|nr:response regulator [bacterium]
MGMKKKRILVVDDETVIREPVVEYLEYLGYAVEAAENGIEALNYLRLNGYDLIILDIKMPYIDGKQLGQALKEENIVIPILVVTAVAEHEKIYQEVDRIPKIFSLKTLQEKVSGILAGPIT